MLLPAEGVTRWPFCCSRTGSGCCSIAVPRRSSPSRSSGSHLPISTSFFCRITTAIILRACRFSFFHECYQGSRTKPLLVYGPDGTREKLTQGLESLFPGIPALPFALEYRDQKPGDTLRSGALEAQPFEVDHYSRGTAFGYRVSLEGRVVVFSGDTAWTEALVTQTAGADLFICECSSFERPVDKHMTHRELEQHHARIGAKRTLLVHPGDDVLEREQELVFELAHDGMEVTL